MSKKEKHPETKTEEQLETKTEQTPEEIDFEFYLVKQSVLYKGKAHQKNTVIVAVKREEDQKLQNLKKLASTKIIDGDSMLFQMTKEQFVESGIEPEMVWFESGTDAELRNFVLNMLLKEEAEKE